LDRLPCAQNEISDKSIDKSERVGPRQGRQAQLDGTGAKVIATGGGVLSCHVRGDQALQVAVNLGCSHVTRLRDRAQRRWCAERTERLEDAQTDFDGLDSPAAAATVFAFIFNHQTLVALGRGRWLSLSKAPVPTAQSRDLQGSLENESCAFLLIALQHALCSWKTDRKLSRYPRIYHLIRAVLRQPRDTLPPARFDPAFK
jgi:hypothetical protein